MGLTQLSLLWVLLPLVPLATSTGKWLHGVLVYTSGNLQMFWSSAEMQVFLRKFRSLFWSLSRNLSLSLLPYLTVSLTAVLPVSGIPWHRGVPRVSHRAAVALTCSPQACSGTPLVGLFPLAVISGWTRAGGMVLTLFWLWAVCRSFLEPEGFLWYWKALDADVISWTHIRYPEKTAYSVRCSAAQCFSFRCSSHRQSLFLLSKAWKSRPKLPGLLYVRSSNAALIHSQTSRAVLPFLSFFFFFLLSTGTG